MDINSINPEDFPKHLQSLDLRQLLAQELMQQGAVHALAFLLKSGVTESNAADMLASLRAHATSIRVEHKRRGTTPLFGTDQTEFS